MCHSSTLQQAVSIVNIRYTCRCILLLKGVKSDFMQIFELVIFLNAETKKRYRLFILVSGSTHSIICCVNKVNLAVVVSVVTLQVGQSGPTAVDVGALPQKTTQCPKDKVMVVLQRKCC